MATDQEIIKLYEEGNSGKKIETLTGVSATQVRRILKRNNVEGRSNRTDKEVEDQIIADYKNNISSEKLAVKYGMNATTICRIIKRYDGDIKGATFFNKKYEIDESFLDVIDTQEKAYFIGFMYADGHIHKKENGFNLCIHKKDKDILVKFSMLFHHESDESHFLHSDNIHREDAYLNFIITNKKLFNKIITHGCVPAKTFKVSFPKTVPDHLLSHFFRGLYDGDRCLRLNDEKRSTVGLTGYTKFLTEIKEYFIKELDITGYIEEYTDKENVADLMIRKNQDMLKFLDWLYKDVTIYLDRKFNKYQDMRLSILEKLEKNAQFYH